MTTEFAGKQVAIFRTKTNREATLRFPTVEDCPVMAEFINTMSKEDTFIRFSGEQVTLEEEKEFVQKMLRSIQDEDAVYLLCFVDGKLAASFSAERNVEFKKRQLHIVTLGIIVAKDFRGDGIGRLMMKLGIKEAIKCLPNISMFILSVFGNNTNALEFYKSLGFEEYGRLRDGILHQGVFVDHVEMALPVAT